MASSPKARNKKAPIIDQEGAAPQTKERVKLSPAAEARLRVVTMKDIAKVAGVTSMTVSRVMKGDNYVAPATRELVLRIAQELNYTTNLAGRALRTGRTDTIGIIGGALEQPFNAAIIAALESLLTKSGYQTKLILNFHDLNQLIKSSQANAVDGFIVTGMHCQLQELRSEGYELTQPFVNIIIVKLPDEDCVQCDLVPAVREALHFMLQQGRKRIAYVGIGNLDVSRTTRHTEIRTGAYLDVMKEAQREPELISAAFHYEVPGLQRVEILREYFASNGCPDAILCVNDDVAMQTYRALMDVGCRIPEDTLLVGCDGLAFTAYFEPPLSTISQPIGLLAEQAWSFLKNRIADPQIAPQYACFNAQLVIRKSLQP
ncbi:LacI family transcriptional regulator [bacterium]|nr:MAG: LacI family transcriptional regulator [bacterium]